MSYQNYGNTSNPQQKNEKSNVERQSQYDPKKDRSKGAEKQSNTTRNQKDGGKGNRG